MPHPQARAPAIATSAATLTNTRLTPNFLKSICCWQTGGDFVESQDNPFTPDSNPTGSQIPGYQASWVDEVYAMGLRNPFRLGFDRNTGKLCVGDVGQDTYEEVDIIVTPTSPMTATRPDQTIVEIDGEERGMLNSIIQFLCGFSLTGVPTLAFPAGLADDGLPVSVQIVGPHLHDPRVLAVGQALERVMGPFARPPAM